MSKCLSVEGILYHGSASFHAHSVNKKAPGYFLEILTRKTRVCAYVLNSLIEHFQDLQLRPQSQRLQILDLLNALMSRHRNALKEMGNESLIGIADLVSGEKDPRNLMIIFSNLKAVMVEWDIANHAEVGHPARIHRPYSRLSDAIRLRVLLLSHHLPASPE